MIDDTIIVTEKDYLRIGNLFKNLNSTEVEDLEVELERARLVPDNEVPSDVVTMNSQLIYYDFASDKKNTVTLVYPSESNPSEGKVSVLAPLGAALIGLRVGQEINWRFPDGKTHRLKVEGLIYQPERSGDWHL